MSLEQQRFPSLRKESIVVETLKELNDFRPVALTSLVMKSFERLVKGGLLEMVVEPLDPMQFACTVVLGRE